MKLNLLREWIKKYPKGEVRLFYLYEPYFFMDD